tara:strand:- start:98 stop:412 length:315 start_codon:yes stop_codon:yes gene_type:complete
MTSIQGGTAPVSTSDDYLAIAVQDVQTLVIQCKEQPARFAFSEGGLDFSYTSYELHQSTDEFPFEMVLTFPLSAFSGTLYFRSQSSAVESSVTVYATTCGNTMY